MICEKCGAEYLPKNHYMSNLCGMCLAKERILRDRKPGVEMVMKPCKRCGKVAEISKRGKYCLECAAERQIERDREDGAVKAEKKKEIKVVIRNKKRAVEAHRAIVEINERARKNGRSYGQEVALNGGGY